MSGIWSIRDSLLVTKYVDLVISPDTGILHGAGCFDTPKIGLLTSTSKENITKYFKNDYSLESTVECSPCFRIIDLPEIQCPMSKETLGACECMASGMPAERVYDRICEVINLNGR